MSSHDQIYKNQAEKYEQLISKQPDLSEVIRGIRPFRGLDVADLGAGSGRLAAKFVEEVNSLICTDRSEAMLQILGQKLQREHPQLHNWSTAVCDHRDLHPIADHSIDLVVSGWSICYLTNTDVSDWQDNLAVILSEVNRIVRDDGTVIIIETLGTGTTEPNPPTYLTPYYRVLEEVYGFSHQWIRTDYNFQSIEEAQELTRFFFGEQMARQVLTNKWTKLPECAGIWWKQM